MLLGEIYKHKKTKDIIQIDSFATKIGTRDDMVVVVAHIFKNGTEIGSMPSFNSYGTQEEIEREYELLVSQEDQRKYSSWEEIYDLIEEE